jgi:hypothetical protein
MVNYNVTAANARLAAGLIALVKGQSVDGGSSFGQLVIGTSALSGGVGILCTITLRKPSFTIASRIATLVGVPFIQSPSANGAAALAELRDSDGLMIINGLTVGTSGTDFIVSTTTLLTTVPFDLTGGTLAHP